MLKCLDHIPRGTSTCTRLNFTDCPWKRTCVPYCQQYKPTSTPASLRDTQNNKSMTAQCWGKQLFRTEFYFYSSKNLLKIALTYYSIHTIATQYFYEYSRLTPVYMYQHRKLQQLKCFVVLFIAVWFCCCCVYELMTFIPLEAFQQWQTQYFKNCMSNLPCLWEDKSSSVTSLSLQAHLLSIL